MSPLEQYRDARRAVAGSHLALLLLASYAQPESIGATMLKAVALAQHDNAHTLLRRARRRLVLSALASILSALVGIVIVWLMLLGAIALFELITNR